MVTLILIGWTAAATLGAYLIGFAAGRWSA